MTLGSLAQKFTDRRAVTSRAQARGATVGTTQREVSQTERAKEGRTDTRPAQPGRRATASTEHGKKIDRAGGGNSPFV